nr:hypothetical protein [Variovorax boronicumulans]
MNAARTTLGLWLLLQLLLGSLHSPVAAPAQGPLTAAQCRDDAARPDRADALAEHPRVQRTPSPSADDMLAGADVLSPHPAVLRAQPAAATSGRIGAPVHAAYRARAPPQAA